MDSESENEPKKYNAVNSRIPNSLKKLKEGNTPLAKYIKLMQTKVGTSASSEP